MTRSSFRLMLVVLPRILIVAPDGPFCNKIAHGPSPKSEHFSNFPPVSVSSAAPRPPLLYDGVWAGSSHDARPYCLPRRSKSARWRALETRNMPHNKIPYSEHPPHRAREVPPPVRRGGDEFLGLLRLLFPNAAEGRAERRRR